MRIIDCAQGTKEWFEARRGLPTSSEFSKIICCDGKPSTQRKKYMWRLAGERLGGDIEEGFMSFAMAKGKEKEDQGRALYEFIREPIQKVGFCISDDGRCGSSTDGLINKNGVFELKCPEIATHIGYLIENDIPSDYYQQTQGELFVTKREYVEFMSFYPGIKPLIIRETPDEVFQKVLKRELEIFCEELDLLVEKLK